MFTGIVEERGRVHRHERVGPAVRLTVEATQELAGGCSIGESVAVNGCCLTVVAVEGRLLSFDAGAETLSKTNLGELAVGDAVNLERALPVDGRLGGHFVQGHVDGVGRVAVIERHGEWCDMWFEVPPSLARYMVPKGSVAVDGVSLTVVQSQPERFSVALVPHTLEVTTLGIRRVGDHVNIETDILGKYVERFLSERGQT